MLRKLAYAGVFVGAAAVATVVGCTDNGQMNGDRDFATSSNGDMAGGGGDMNVMRTYKNATPNEIDTNTIGGEFGKGTAVSLSNLIVLDPPYGFSAKINVAKDACRYEVWAQDPSCSTAPCGILLVTKAIMNPGGVGAFCPYASDTTTALKDVWKGDKVDVKGVVDTFANTMGMDTVVQHEVELDELDITASDQNLPTPMAVTDSGQFVPYSGGGWAQYEGTYIKLSPASGKFTVTLDTANGSWTTAPGGAQFADTFNPFFRPDGGAANMWPPTGTMFSSISGIVSAGFGGSILPIENADFAP
jgi:hypothetical protein